MSKEIDMGMRLNMVFGRAARCAAAVLAATFVISCAGTVSSHAGALSVAQKQQMIAEQKAEEQQMMAQRQTDQAVAQDTVDEQIEIESRIPGVPSKLTVTTSTSTSGISAENVKLGKRYVTLKWQEAENCDSYQIYYKYKTDKGYRIYKKPVKGTSRKMLFKNNREVFLAVAGLNGDNQSNLSESVVIWPGYGDYVNATKIKFSASESVLYTGFSSTFKVNTTASMLKTYKIKWSTSDKKIAKVSQSGKVTAVADGTATITAQSHAGFTVSKKVTVKTLTPSVVPDLTNLSPSKAKKVANAAGFKVSVKKVFIKKKDMNKKYPGVKMGKIMKQNKKAGASLSQGSTITLTYGDEIYYCGVGAEAVVQWAEKVAADNSYGYSMGVYTGRGLDRLCPYTNSGASKDYDCATFVNAALAFSGMGKDFMDATVKPSPVVRGVRDRLVKNGWKKVLIKRSYKKNGKTKYYYSKPSVKELKRGDIVLNCSCHIQIHAGNGLDVGAHNNYDGKSGDSSGREVSVNTSWTGYNEVYRYYGNIGK